MSSRLTSDDCALTTHHSRLTSHVSRLCSHHSPLTTHVSRLTSHDYALTTHHSPFTPNQTQSSQTSPSHGNFAGPASKAMTHTRLHRNPHDRN
jgi:hypothetical protein